MFSGPIRIKERGVVVHAGQILATPHFPHSYLSVSIRDKMRFTSSRSLVL